MKILVLIKQVPDMEKVKFDSEKGVVDRKSAGTEINPFDLNALEAAVQIKEQVGGEVIALTMGPPTAESALREAISRGADDGILVSDRKFGGSDTWATSSTLSAAIRKLGTFDLIIAGEKTVDGDTGQVGPETAEMLGIPHVAFVNEVREISETGIHLVSEIWDGSYLKEMAYPGLVTVTKSLNSPRLPSFKMKMKAKKAELRQITIADLEGLLTEEQTGFKGSPTKVKKIVVPEEKGRECQMYRDDLEKAIEAVFSIAQQKKVLN